MVLHNAAVTGSLTVNGTDVSSITGSSTYSASFASQITSLNAATASLNTYTSSNNTNISALNAQSASFLAYTASNDAKITSLNTFSSSILSYTSSNDAQITSIYSTTSSLNSYTSSANTKFAGLDAASGSAITRLSALEVASGSAINRLSSLETASGSAITRLSALEVASGSAITRLGALETASGSAITRLNSIENKTGSYATTGSNTFVGGQYFSSSFNPTGFTTTASLYTDGGLRVTKDAYISGTLYLNNVTVFGTQSVAYISSSQLNIGTNIITVNTDTPSVRFGGLAVYDSGSTGLTGSMLWDSQNNHWVYSNPSGSSYSGGMFISGPRTAALGSETGTTSCMLLAGQGGDHLTSSMIYHDSTVTCIPNTLIGSTVCGSTSTFSSTSTACNFVTSGNTLFGITLKGRSSDNYGAIGFYSSDGGTRYGYLQSHSTNCGQLIVNGDGGGQAIFDCRGVVLTSALTGTTSCFSGNMTTAGCIGIGTNAAATPLHIATTGLPAIRLTLGSEARCHNINGVNLGRDLQVLPFRHFSVQAGNGITEGQIVLNAYEDFIVGTGASYTQRLILNSSGNLGLGVTPSAWVDILPLQIKNASFAGSGNVAYFGANYFYDGQNKFISNGRATRLQQDNGEFLFLTSTISGTAGNAITFTQAMTLNASGNLSIGNTNDTYKLDVSGGIRAKAGNGNQLILDNSAERFTQINLQNNGTQKAAIWWDNTNTELVLLASATGTGHLKIASTGAATFSSSVSTGAALTVTGTNSTSANNTITGYSADLYALAIRQKGASAGISGTNFMAQIISATGAEGLEIYTPNSKELIFGTNATERMRISSDGAVGVGNSSPSSYGSGYANLWVGSSGKIGYLSVSNGSVNLELNADGNGVVRTRSNHPLIFGTNETERMRITSTGIACFACTVCASTFRTNGGFYGCVFQGAGFSTLTGGAGTGNAIFDTVTRSDAALYEVSIVANPNGAGSGAYADFYYGDLFISTGFDGSVKNFIFWCQRSTPPRCLYGSGGGNLTVNACMFYGGAEYSCVGLSGTYTIRFKINGYNSSSTGDGTTIFLKQII